MRNIILGGLITVVLVGTALMVERSIRLSKTGRSDAQRGSVTAEKFLPSDLSITDFNSQKTVQLKSFAGKVVLINFWASWCEACMAEMPSIQKLYDQLKGEGLEVVAINVDDNPQKVVPEIVKALGLTFPIYTEKDNVASKAFEVVAIPYSVVADRKLKIVWAESGEKDWSTAKVIGEIRDLLKSKI